MAYQDHELVPPRRPPGEPYFNHSPQGSEYDFPGTARNSGVAHEAYSPYNGSTSRLVADNAAPPAFGSPQTSYRDYPPPQSKEAGNDMYGTSSNSNPYGYNTYTPGVAKKQRRRRVWIIGGLLLLIAIAAAVIIPVYFKLIKKDNGSGGSSSGGSSGGAGGSGSGGSSGISKSPISGGDGSNLTLADGSVIKYDNKWGGTWYYDPENPFANNAQAQSDTPPLNTSWRFGKDPIRGVNLGGWFVLEPFISPALYQKYDGSNDEWTLSVAMRADTAGGGINQLEEHYKTFITEKDFAQIAGSGLNWIRLPIPFWAIDVWPGEPFLERVCWKYILQAFAWARKYGLRIKLDLHTVPGSQNGYNHSGKGGQVNFLNGAMGLANAQRMLNYIRILSEFIHQPEYRDLVPIFGIMNEALLHTIGKETLLHFYFEAHRMIRNITGYGEGNGFYISVHDGFDGISNWSDDFQGADRVILDTHPYFSFNGQTNDEPLAQQPMKPCRGWAAGFNSSQESFGVTIAGEFSNGMNDCGFFLKGTRQYRTTYEAGGGDCATWDEWEKWTPDVKAGLKRFTLASMDALHNSFFFWTWKIGNESVSGSVRAPLWSYQLGLENGWMPAHPNEALGVCAGLGQDSNPFNGNYKAYQTGGAGAGTLAAGSQAAYGAWPPATIPNVVGGGGAATDLPQYTLGAPQITLPPATVTVTNAGAKATETKTIVGGDGWANDNDKALAPTTIAGCQYLNPWDALASAPPAACGAPTARARL